MTLEQQLHSFVKELQDTQLEGFKELANDSYTDDYKTTSDELEYLKNEIARAVHRNDQEDYDLFVNEYQKQFEKVNKDLARQAHADMMDNYLDEGLDNLDAQVATVSNLWRNPKFRRWLPAQVRMTQQSTGRQVYLVATHDHAPKEKPYVTLEEMVGLRSSGRDPWEFVMRRHYEMVNQHDRSVS